MLYIKFNNGSDREWHVGRGNKEIKKYSVEVSSIQADGDELEHIEDKFNNIPTVKSERVVTWFGDDAKFIVANL